MPNPRSAREPFDAISFRLAPMLVPAREIRQPRREPRRGPAPLLPGMYMGALPLRAGAASGRVNSFMAD